MTDITLSRRKTLQGLLAISAAGAISACSNSDTGKTKSTNAADLAYASEGAFFSASEMAFLSSVAQTIIPQTDTAGAVEAGVPETLQGLASEWGDDAYRRYWREGVRELSGAFRKQSGQNFADMSDAQQLNLLSRFDAKVFDGSADNKFYRDLKSTVVQAYYMSEAGASEELAYEAVPGEWIGCVPLSDQPKTWAT